MASITTLKASPSSCPRRLRSSKKVNAALPSSNVNFRRVTGTTNYEKLTRSKTAQRPIIDTRNGSYMDKATKMTTIDELRLVADDELEMGIASKTTTLLEMYAILEAVADRIEMHRNIGEQRNNWNTLLLNSINMMTLTATTMVSLGLIGDGAGTPPLMKLSSTLLFGSSTLILLIMNKLQPSQLAEEQRNATRLFKQLMHQIQISLQHSSPPTKADVDYTMEKVLALDRAYPLPLLGGKMLEKFPNKFDSAVWWPKPKTTSSYVSSKRSRNNNGWSKDLEEEMNVILDVLKAKDEEDYLRLGSIALKVNKALAVSGPALTAIAAATAALPGGFSAVVSAVVSAVAGAAAVGVNSLEHGGQVGMVVEMYRNCAGFFKLMTETIETTLEEKDWEKRENGELFERKVALKLGRSLSDLRAFARNQVVAGAGVNDEEFGSKLF